MYLLEYTNRNGKVIRLTFNAWSDIEKWTARLDRRIEQGRCGGYMITEFKEGRRP